jgi:hypothetical protein
MKAIVIVLATIISICESGNSFGGDVECVYIDNGFVAYCNQLAPRAMEHEVYVHGVDQFKERRHYVVKPDLPPYYIIAQGKSRFPMAWTVKEKSLRCIFPDAASDAMNRVILGIFVVDDIVYPEKDMNRLNLRGETEVDGGGKLYCFRNRQLFGYSSGVFASNLLSDARNVVTWYALSGTNFIARVPLAQENSDVWMPCAKPARFRWMDFLYTGWESYPERIVMLHSQDVVPDGFSPIGSVGVSGKKVMSDDPKAAFPKDADWLIWEESDTDNRLCQMRGGRWSVCNDAPRKDAPKTIVVNNDANMVHLLYSKVIDPKDVEGSLKSIVEYLRSRGELSPGKNAGKGGNP